jgi:FkbM family methyltransferase
MVVDARKDLVTLGLDSIPGLASRLSRGTEEYGFFEEAFRGYFLRSGFAEGNRATLGPFGELIFPYIQMGAVSSLDLFGLDELILFSIYQANRERYNHFADLGANLGLHSLVAGRLGWRVTAFEPDPSTFVLLEKNLQQNSVNARTVQKAVGAAAGSRVFTRVMGNLTGSHLSGTKEQAYGELELFPVEVQAFTEIMAEHDFLKIDVEGAEAELMCSTVATDWLGTDAVLEIGSERNASAIFEHFQSLDGVSMFSQKRGWDLVQEVEHLPFSHREGSVFLTAGDHGPFA